ncbi:FAD-dependent oxidoreductase [Synechococcus sp. UW179A]|uniref:FAD-dependent oxidoreductase n=1 Tax=Synechococcus sp. UW179A TaxID=2575510 RepID=UPI000E0E14D0|nr:FAD-dependent oxidoreductase [Synechococcus sp. UW179A]
MTVSIDSVDVLVWGGGTGGTAAAIQAARGGASTLLLTPGAWLGGMVSAAGVCCPDGNELSPWQTGLWGAFLHELEQREPEGLDHNWVSCFGYRPQTAESILQNWLHQEPRLLWWPGCQLLSVERAGSLITGLRIEVDGEIRRVTCRVAIDGSDRGDLLPLANAPFRFGWEPKEQWQEPSAPSRQRLTTDPFFRHQPVQSPTWVVMGQLQSDQLPNPQRQGDHPIGSQLPDPFYGASDTFGLEKTITYGRLPSGLVMLNWPLHGNDWHRGLERAFLTDPDQEAALFSEMQQHSLCFADELRKATDGWLQLGEAFPSSAESRAPWLAAMPYWREGRRVVGRTTVIEQDLLPLAEGVCILGPPVNDSAILQSIAVGNYANDHHYPGDDWPLAPKSCRWGGRWTGTPFCIPFGALLSDAVDNLLIADKAFSTSHMANGATRLQPLILNVGQAAGAASALAVESNRQPSELSVRSVQNRLIGDAMAPSAVVPLWDTPWHHSQWFERQVSALDQKPLTAAHPETLDSGRTLRATVSPDNEGGYRIQCEASEPCQLITLEPAVNDRLQAIDRPTSVELQGSHNPWGGWFRTSSLR